MDINTVSILNKLIKLSTLYLIKINLNKVTQRRGL